MLTTIVNHLLKGTGIKINGLAPHDPQMSPRAVRNALLRGSLGLGEAYVAGEWACHDLPEFFRRLMHSGVTDRVPRLDLAIQSLLRYVSDPQSVSNAHKVARKHYDISPEFYGTMLGRERIYTCARWKGVSTLEEAQWQKNDLISRKAGLLPGSSVLDIGCGWGGFLAQATRTYQARGTGVTISREQHAHVQSLYSKEKLLSFFLADYRDIPQLAERFDAIVSICMIEHVGHRHLREYFKVAHGALKDEGLFVLQCISAADPKNVTDPWMDAYIFPGGELVTRDAIREATQGLFNIVDEEYFNDDYVRTLRAWYERINLHAEEIESEYGTSFFRMFEYYLLSLAGVFQTDRISVGQLVLAPIARTQPYTPIRC